MLRPPFFTSCGVDLFSWRSSPHPILDSRSGVARLMPQLAKTEIMPLE